MLILFDVVFFVDVRFFVVVVVVVDCSLSSTLFCGDCRRHYVRHYSGLSDSGTE